MAQTTLYINVVDREGIEHEIEATAGVKIMEPLRELSYGVAAICGGMCSCATCHVYVDPQWVPRLLPPNADELDLIQGLAAYSEVNSRLSCQLPFTAALSGIKVTIAPES